MRFVISAPDRSAIIAAVQPYFANSAVEEGDLVVFFAPASDINIEAASAAAEFAGATSVTTEEEAAPEEAAAAAVEEVPVEPVVVDEAAADEVAAEAAAEAPVIEEELPPARSFVARFRREIAGDVVQGFLRSVVGTVVAFGEPPTAWVGDELHVSGSSHDLGAIEIAAVAAGGTTAAAVVEVEVAVPVVAEPAAVEEPLVAEVKVEEREERSSRSSRFSRSR